MVDDAELRKVIYGYISSGIVEFALVDILIVVRHLGKEGLYLEGQYRVVVKPVCSHVGRRCPSKIRQAHSVEEQCVLWRRLFSDCAVYEQVCQK